MIIPSSFHSPKVFVHRFISIHILFWSHDSPNYEPRITLVISYLHIYFHIYLPYNICSMYVCSIFNRIFSNIFQAHPQHPDNHPPTTAGSPRGWPGRAWRRAACAPCAATRRRCPAGRAAPCPARRCPVDPRDPREPAGPGVVSHREREGEDMRRYGRRGLIRSNTHSYIEL